MPNDDPFRAWVEEQEEIHERSEAGPMPMLREAFENPTNPDPLSILELVLAMVWQDNWPLPGWAYAELVRLIKTHPDRTGRSSHQGKRSPAEIIDQRVKNWFRYQKVCELRAAAASRSLPSCRR